MEVACLENVSKTQWNAESTRSGPVQSKATLSEVTVDKLKFMFAVGIECSCPVINGNYRVDEMRDTGHYEHWKKDLGLVTELGLRYLRYGPPIHRIFKGPGE